MNKPFSVKNTKLSYMGFPSPAADYAEERISLDKTIIKHPAATDFFRVHSDSMISAFIPAGALLVVDRSLTPQNMNIVVAVVEGEFMTRYLKKNDLRGWLVAANSNWQDWIPCSMITSSKTT